MYLHRCINVTIQPYYIKIKLIQYVCTKYTSEYVLLIYLFVMTNNFGDQDVCLNDITTHDTGTHRHYKGKFSNDWRTRYMMVK